ncbi:papain family cysteine protease (macronuclear) [Tetrahymena thermophila SB210]|uniref:Papain family cysteine protease n=1 Tax=Tetrahymena thermophila (strain SB210) TaxID=312017 RepID=Q23H06_TETTS|nr:papain family cysteine protease [Tetrahymena thermophila SB210]EAR95841.1 papain family cysteine protease [Tetrahymena thermophila SB210]|eukprot:XP_001016086.1 papain family cysteine protease [Tetrahymena thermophila SB210]
MNRFILLSIIMLMPLCLAQNVSVEKLLAYNKWSSEHQRVYLNEHEKLFRQMVFFENLQKIQDHNSNPNNTYSIHLNQFSDMTKQEFAEKILMKQSFVENFMKGASQQDNNTNANHNEANHNDANHNDANHEMQLNSKNFTIATSIDWRSRGAVTQVKWQGNCGACWAFSATGVMESFNFIQNKALVEFSEQQLLDCVIPANGYPSSGCHGGWPVQCIDYASKVGILNQDRYYYFGVQMQCRVTGTNNGFKPKSWVQIPNNSDALKTALNFSPVSVAVDGTNWTDYKSGVFNGCDSHVSLNHAVLVVGYDEQGNWIIKNSWSTLWGEGGYMRLAPNNSYGILNLGYQITS